MRLVNVGVAENSTEKKFCFAQTAIHKIYLILWNILLKKTAPTCSISRTFKKSVRNTALIFYKEIEVLFKSGFLLLILNVIYAEMAI